MSTTLLRLTALVRYSLPLNFRSVLTFACAFLLSASIASAYEKTREYEKLEIAGWRVLLSSEYAGYPDQREKILAELGQQIAIFQAVVPARAVKRLRKVRIFVEYTAQIDAGGQYHVSRDWLSKNGYNPDKAGAVELNYNFYRWRRSQPMLLLHELSHAYHYRVLKENNRRVISVFDHAVEAGIYESVKRANGQRVRAYALTDHKEYFAELSEAYFGKNDYQPMTREELATFDPEGLAMLEWAWGK